MNAANPGCSHLSLLARAGWFLAFGLYAPLLWAQVYKCEKAGKTEFSDKPCADDTKPMKLQTTGGALGAIDFKVTTRHYAVTGPDFAAAYRSLRARGPGGFAGWARWKVDYKYTSKTVAADCLLMAVTIRIDGEIMMPDWVEEKNASLKDQAMWQAMYS